MPERAAAGARPVLPPLSRSAETRRLREEADSAQGIERAVAASARANKYWRPRTGAARQRGASSTTGRVRRGPDLDRSGGGGFFRARTGPGSSDSSCRNFREGTKGSAAAADGHPIATGQHMVRSRRRSSGS
jgi:hypothetical protein